MRASALPHPGFEPAALLSDLGHNLELDSLAREVDPELFFEDLLAYGSRRESSGDLEAAARVYGRLQENGPEEISRRARSRLEAILGRGETGPRVEFLLRRFAAEAGDPAALLAMGGAVTVFRMARLATLARLTASPAANFFTRGFGARATASLTGFVLEAPAFTFAGRLANLGLGRVQDWSSGALGRDLASSYLVLGGLKFAGWASGATYRGIAGSVGAVRERPLRALFQQWGMFSGILLGHALEQRAGLRPAQAGATTLVDSLALLLQFHVAGRLSRHAFGEGFTHWETSLEARQAQLLSLPARGFDRFRPPSLAPAMAMAVIGPMPEAHPEPLRMAESRFPPSSAPAYEMFHFPVGGRGERPARLRYSEEAQALWNEIRPELRRVDAEAPREDSLTRRLDIETADRFWEFQIRDFAELLSARVEIHGPERVLEPFSGQFLRPKPDLIRQALELSGGKGRVYELSLPYANVSFGRANVKGQYANLRHLLGELEDVFSKQLQLQHVQNGRLRLRLPSFALWEGMLRARFGSAAHLPIFVDGIIPRDPVMRLRGNLLAPIGLSPQPTYISELNGSVHPFFVPFHDFYHATMASMLPPELCRSSAALYFPLQRALPASGLKQEHLNRLSDLDPGSEFNGNPELFVKFTLLPFWKSFFQHFDANQMTQRRLAQYPQFLRHYRRLLRDEAATPGVDPVWRSAFDRYLEKTSDEFTRLLTSVLRKDT